MTMHAGHTPFRQSRSSPAHSDLLAIMASTKIVKLNVGGEVFMTSQETLLSAGESFFSSLLSGRHDSAKDDTGAYFIDRSPKYFEPILLYLRSGILEIPPGMSRATLYKEAEFYQMQNIIKHLDHIEAEHKKKEPAKKVVPFMKDIGCYVNTDDSHALMFSCDDKLMSITGDQAFTQSLVVHNHSQVPVEWQRDQTHERSFAQFYQQHVEKGTYKMNSEGRGMILTLPGSTGGIHRQHLATLSKDLTTLCVTSYSCTAGSVKFLCTHTNPHHFHIYRLHRF